MEFLSVNGKQNGFFTCVISPENELKRLYASLIVVFRVQRGNNDVKRTVIKTCLSHARIQKVKLENC